MKDVVKFLEKNGFKKYNESCYMNDNCSVNLCKDHYRIISNGKSDKLNENLNIYWLIGVLTYYGYMDKNYKQ